MSGRASHRYAPLPTRPPVDIPYESDDEADLRKRSIPSVDHPPTDMRRFAPPPPPSPPVGVALSSLVVLSVGLGLLVLMAGMGSGWVKVGGGMRVLCGVVGGFLSLSGGVTLFNYCTHGKRQYEGGYLFPSYER